MVFRKKSFRRRRRGARRSEFSRYGSWFRKGIDPTTAISTAWANRPTVEQLGWAVDKLKGLVNSEMFKYDQSQTALNLTNSGGILHLTSVTQGDGDGQRTGNSIFVRSVNIKGVLKFNTSSTSFGQPCRLMVVLDTQQGSDSSPSVLNILESATTYSHLNSETVGRFKILKSYIINLSTGTNPVRPFQINIPMRHHVRFNGTAPTDIQRGGLYFVYMSNEGSLYPTMDYEARLSYHDN